MKSNRTPSLGTLRAVLVAVACVAALAGCGATGGKSPRADDPNNQSSESGITVFGTVDMSVQRSR